MKLVRHVTHRNTGWTYRITYHWHNGRWRYVRCQHPDPDTPTEAE